MPKRKKIRKVVTPEKRKEIERSRSIITSTTLFIIFFLFFIIVILSVLSIQISHSFRSNDLTTYRDNRYNVSTHTLSKRGTIYDKFENPIASDIKEYKLIFYLDKNKRVDDYVSDPEKTTKEVLKVIGKTDDKVAYDYIYDKLANSPEGTYQTYIGKYGDGISLQQKSELESTGLKGIDYEESLARYYPFGEFAPYFVGYATKNEETNEVDGHIGIEEQTNGFLKSKNGYTIQNVDDSGIKVDGNGVDNQQSAGKDIISTLDPQVQSIVQTEVNKSFKDIKFERHTTFVMDAKTGEVLASYTLPSFDPNVVDVKNYVDPLTEYCYEPGSTMKSFTVAAAMENKTWKPAQLEATGQRFNDSVWGKDKTVVDYIYSSFNQNWGQISWEQGFYFSSNTVMSHIIDPIGYEKFQEYETNKFLFGNAINNDYLKTASCDYSPVYPLEIANTSFGQGMTANVLQVAQGYSMFANDGDMVTPHFVKKVVDPTNGETLYDSTTDDSLRTKNVISKETSDEVLKLLQGAVYYNFDHPNGLFQATGHNYGYGDVKIAGKSGTSQLANATGYGKGAGQTISSFAGFAPADDPQIYIYTMTTRPTTGYSSKVTGAMYGEIADQVISYLNSKNDGSEKVAEVKEYKLKDYVGKNIDESKSDLEKLGYKTYVVGSGNVTSQYPIHDQSIKVSDTIYLYGSGGFDIKKFVGMSTAQADSICKLMSYKCDINMVGTIKEVKDIDGINFDMTIEPVKNITTIESSISSRNPLTVVTPLKKEGN